MTEIQLVVGLLVVLIVAVAIVAAEIVRLNNTLGPILNSSLVRTATSF